jgi:hypothetical protein
MIKTSIIPSRQGSLDSLCGIYSIVNSLAYLYDGRINRRRLRAALLETYQNRWELLKLIEDGMDQHEMDYLIKRVLLAGYYHKHFPVLVTKPFKSREGLRTKKVLNDITYFLNSAKYTGCRLVLIGNQYHWSLVKRANECFLYLFDSTGMKKSFRSSYSLISGRTAYELIPDAIYFIERSFEEVCDDAL